MSFGLLAAKLALGPVLLPQAKWAQRTALRLPEAAGPREGVAGVGDVKTSVLVVGDSSAAGVGVADQAQALALPLAQAVAARVDAAVRWQLVAQSGLNTSELIELIRQVKPGPADVAVVVVGVNDVTSQTPATAFATELAALVRVVPATKFLFCGVPPMHLFSALPQPLRWYLGRHARLLDAAMHEWCEGQGHGYCASDLSTDPRMLADDGYHPGPLLYPQWASHLAKVVVP
ncbi:MAG TPA: SGNH/GDSL hydrolase family protein [Ramlibacter sp.]|nr:SGNH/GDSL hydrolase family protein [Ramlibacter sp.]